MMMLADCSHPAESSIGYQAPSRRQANTHLHFGYVKRRAEKAHLHCTRTCGRISLCQHTASPERDAFGDVRSCHARRHPRRTHTRCRTAPRTDRRSEARARTCTRANARAERNLRRQRAGARGRRGGGFHGGRAQGRGDDRGGRQQKAAHALRQRQHNKKPAHGVNARGAPAGPGHVGYKSMRTHPHARLPRKSRAHTRPAQRESGRALPRCASIPPLCTPAHQASDLRVGRDRSDCPRTDRATINPEL